MYKPTSVHHHRMTAYHPQANGLLEQFHRVMSYLDDITITSTHTICVEIWGNALSIHIQSIVKLQNKIVTLITSSYHTTEQLYNNTGILPFKIFVTHRIGLLMYKLSHGNVPKPNNNVHTHFTRHAHNFHTMRGNNEFIYRTFVFQSVLIWNKLLQNINIHVSYTRFKHQLKDFLLSNVIAFRYDK